jgi:hypothetical protein
MELLAGRCDLEGRALDATKVGLSHGIHFATRLAAPSEGTWRNVR